MDKYVLLGIIALYSTVAGCSPDTEVVESQYIPTAEYPCDCPDDIASDGKRCGARSAFNKPGGRIISTCNK